MIFYPGNEKNKFGFYRVGDQFCSYSHFEALEEKQRSNKEISWDFNDSFFSSIDWTQEPTETLEELYIERARQLRDQYDYLVLFFSGGADSHNILNAFVNGGVHLDEIVSHHSHRISGVDKNSSVDLMGEISLAAVPEANRLLETSPRTKHRVIDVSDFIESTMIEIATTEMKYDVLYLNNHYHGPHRFGVKTIPKLPEYRKLYDQGRKVCFIHGIDKPEIYFEDRKWSFRFISHVDSSWDVQRQMENHNFGDDAFFYWDPSAWKIPVKQSHEIRKFFTSNTGLLKQIMHQKSIESYSFCAPQPSSLVLFGKQIPIGLIKKIIYPHWRNDIVDFGKSPWSTLVGKKNDWYLKSSTSSVPGSREHRAALKKLAQYLDYSGNLANCNNHLLLSRPYYF
jgi:hypothetical protein